MEIGRALCGCSLTLFKSAPYACSLTIEEGADTTQTRQSSCHMSDEEWDEEWEVGARWRVKCEITEEELSYARDLWRHQPFPDQEGLDDWLRIMEEVVGVIGYAY